MSTSLVLSVNLMPSVTTPKATKCLPEERGKVGIVFGKADV